MIKVFFLVLVADEIQIAAYWANLSICCLYLERVYPGLSMPIFSLPD